MQLLLTVRQVANPEGVVEIILENNRFLNKDIRDNISRMEVSTDREKDIVSALRMQRKVELHSKYTFVFV